MKICVDDVVHECRFGYMNVFIIMKLIDMKLVC